MYTLTCPVCVTALRPRVFQGYYDTFTCWTCGCTDKGIVPPGATVMAGAFGYGTDGAPATHQSLQG